MTEKTGSGRRRVRPFHVLLGIAAGAAALQTAQAADLGFARVFGDHAVLQRDQPIAVWGTASPGRQVAVTLDGKTAHATADSQGRWRAELPRLAAGGPYILSAASDGRTVSRQDVMVGDVYLCSGQSNMEFAVHHATNAIGASYAPVNQRLRFLNVQKNSTPEPQAELQGPADWKLAGPDTVGDASAVCYFMARALQARYKVPVGFINASWGGTTIQGWIGAESLRSLPGYAQGVAAVQELGAHPDLAMQHQDARTESWWSAHDPQANAQRAWVAPGFDDKAWAQLTAAGSWKDSGIAAFKDFDGVAWFRTAVDLTPEQAASANALQLGPIDTYDTTWVNGVRVGGASTGWMWRDYPVPPGVFKPGRNVIAVRVLNHGEGGGLTGQPASRGVRLASGKVVPLPAVWKYHLGSRLKGLEVPPAPWDVPTSYTTLYNGMIAPLVGYKFKLAAWYQGESNAGAGEEYRTLLPLMMRDWRQRFDQADLPFIVVQLPAFGPVAKQPGGRSDWGELRDAQAYAVHADSHAGLVVTLDVGDRFDIHPTQKTVVGDRAARAARAVAYGEAITPGGPEVASVRRVGEDIAVSFRNTNGGLVTYSSDKAIGFEVCTASACRFIDGAVAGDEVLLKGAWTPGALVRYAWANAPFINLFSADDLPAAPFQMAVQ
jgi:sialate O-acetylesterase